MLNVRLVLYLSLLSLVNTLLFLLHNFLLNFSRKTQTCVLEIASTFRGRSFRNQLPVTPDVTDQLSELIGKFLMSRKTTNGSSKQSTSPFHKTRNLKIGGGVQKLIYFVYSVLVNQLSPLFHLNGNCMRELF